MKQLGSEYKHGFVSEVESESFPKGLNEEIIRKISAKKNEPEWLLDFRLRGYNQWLKMTEPHWARADYAPIDYQNISYYSAPKSVSEKPKSLDDLDPELLRTFEKLGIPLSEQKRISGVAVDAVFDSVSVGTTHKEILERHGVVFCSISEAVQTHPELVKKDWARLCPLRTTSSRL